MNNAWLNGWTIEWMPQSDFIAYQKELEIMKCAGTQLFGLGAHRENGASGNFAIRLDEQAFIVTAHGAHKGELHRESFVIVKRIDWDKRILYTRSIRRDIQPSSDSLLVGLGFLADQKIRAWVHFHWVIKALRAAIELHYPSVSENDWKVFKAILNSGILEMNMINHTLPDNPNKTLNAAIILGQDPDETFKKAVDLVKSN